MKHPIAQQIEAQRRPHRYTDVLIFVLFVASAVALLVTVALQAPPDWSPW
jgi:hypothetical protein